MGKHENEPEPKSENVVAGVMLTRQAMGMVGLTCMEKLIVCRLALRLQEAHVRLHHGAPVDSVASQAIDSAAAEVELERLMSPGGSS